MGNHYNRKEGEHNKWLVFVLCILFGVLGVHRFYTGHVRTGILYLFTGGIFGIGWVVDAILILFGRFKDADGCYLYS